MIDARIQTVSDFINKECKKDLHQNCQGKWIGFGFIVVCECKCHKKNGIALDGVGGTPTSNTIQNKVIIDGDIQ